MTVPQLLEATRQLESYGTDFAAMTDPQLQEFVGALTAALIVASAELVQRCGGDLPRAERFIHHARMLPRYRLRQKAILYEKLLYRGGEPNRPLLAAQIARMLDDTTKLAVVLQRRFSAATVQ